MRTTNQDSLDVYPELGLVILADGMGGHQAGEVASQLAVQTISNLLLPILRNLPDEAEAELAWLEEAVKLANEAVIAAAERDPNLYGMGTTVVLGLCHRGSLLYAHVGDSRIYRLRDGRLEQLTQDHSVIQAMVDHGVFESLEDARLAGIPSNRLTRGLGAIMDVEVDAAKISVEPGDVWLYCSDGLSDLVSDQEIESIVFDMHDDLAAGADWLLELASANGGADNVSFVLARPSIV